MVKLAFTFAMFANALLHPIHSTLTDLSVDSSTHTIRAVVRVFSDDFGTAAKNAAAPEAYVANHLVIDVGNARVKLSSCGTRRTGELLWVCVTGSFAGSPSSVRIANRVLCDAFSDQVNVVQVTTGATRRSVLFTRGDGAKTISLE